MFSIRDLKVHKKNDRAIPKTKCKPIFARASHEKESAVCRFLLPPERCRRFWAATGHLNVTVIDPSGSVVQGANVSVSNADLGIARSR